MVDMSNGWTDSTPFPKEGLLIDLIYNTLKERMDEIPDWQGRQGVVRLGFAMTEPHPVAIQALSSFLSANTTNVGIHTRFGDGKTGTRRLEKEVLALLSDLYSGGALDGYLTSGGTEGVLCALHLGRNILRRSGKHHLKVFTGALAHHSITKAAEILDIPLEALPVSEKYTLDPHQLRAKILAEKETGLDGILVVSTAGYFSTGLVDDVDKIAEVLEDLQAMDPSFGIYHHVDAAYGGFVLPFTNSLIPFDFRNRKVHSLTTDPHKMGLVPYGCGVLLCRKGIFESVALHAELSGFVDETIIGSRPGAMAAALWAVIHALGRNGYIHIAASCLEKLRYLITSIQQVDPQTLILRHPDMNVAAVSFSLANGKLPTLLEERYRLVGNALPIFENGKKTGTRVFYHFYAMPSLTTEEIERFIQELQVAYHQKSTKKQVQQYLGDFPEPVVEIKQGTTCPRHSVVHPKGQRDPRHYPFNYSFHTFVSRKRTNEPFNSRELYFSKRLQKPVYLYAPDIEQPFCHELGGICVPNHFSLEVLDRFQQDLSLIGAAHFFLHSEQHPFHATVNFFPTGKFRSLEIHLGQQQVHDEIQIFADEIIFKLGKDTHTFYRGNDSYSFSIDTSAEIHIRLTPIAIEPRLAYFQYSSDPYLYRHRHLHLSQLKRFPNRFFGMIAEFEASKQKYSSRNFTDLLRAAGKPPRMEHISGVCGLSEIKGEIKEGILRFDVLSRRNEGQYTVLLPLSLGENLAQIVKMLNVEHPETLDALALAAYGEQIYTQMQSLVSLLQQEFNLDLTGLRLA